MEYKKKFSETALKRDEERMKELYRATSEEIESSYISMLKYRKLCLKSLVSMVVSFTLTLISEDTLYYWIVWVVSIIVFVISLFLWFGSKIAYKEGPQKIQQIEDEMRKNRFNPN